MYCPQCGTQIPDEAAFCPACGSPTAVHAVTTPPAPAPTRRHLPYVLAAIGICIVVLMAVLVVGSMRGGGGNRNADEQVEALATSAPVPSSTATPAATKTRTPRPTGSVAQGSNLVRLSIPSINVDTSVAMEVVPSNGEMPEPRDGEVVWYDFSKLPGFGGRPCEGGNTVLSGKVGTLDESWVLRDLASLSVGAEIVLRLDDGIECKFSVQSNRLVDRSSSSWNEITSETAKESLTIISATDFQGKKVVVTAIRGS
jgi:hypothetical protein